MNQGKYVFSQLTGYLPQRVFDGFVKKHDGNRYVKHFTCWNQLLCMLFGQLTNRESLRDLIVALDAHSGKSYHLGLGKSVTRSNFAKANEVRNSKIFEDFAYHLIAIARELHSSDDFKIKGNIYAFDSSTIDLCLNVFWWAKFRKAKGGIKLHTLYDVNTQIPAFLHITPANVHDVKAMDELVYEAGAHYIFDRAYLDYTRLYKIERCSAYFVVRAKSNTKFRRMYSNKVDKLTGIRCDQIGKLSGFYTSQEYPEKLRRVKYYDKESNRTFVFLTNNMKVTAEEVALLYKKRWQVELFFKWVKQHLKIKSFWGTSENAVKIQIYCAISAYCLVSIVADKLKLKRSTYEILQVLGISLLDKAPINELFMNINYSNVKELDYNQLSLSLF
ncbi:IS4 family transposase [uncultured Salegentibacter sp.]|jgi:transposase|uniref:IS4 family transposase n=1 Tax=uncultured Salegentibacter sp. TaxID=259320 RepID=UPI0030D731A1|tara:strand:+ start:866 stop:2029 length:1164 start_codon:yes stop_codon:yes gene_type:complete